MADTIVQLHSLPLLGALTLKLYPRTGGAIVNGAGDALSEDAAAPGLYAATVTEALSGIHAARVYEDAGGDVIGSFLVDLRDDTGAYDLADPAIAVGDVQVTALTNAALAQLAGVTIRISQPFRGPGVPLEIVQGDDYAHADGRAIEVTVAGLDAGLGLTGASGQLSLKLAAESVTFTATDISRVGDDVVLRLEPSAAETSELRVSRNWQYDVQITLAGGRKITPISEAEAFVLASYSE